VQYTKAGAHKFGAQKPLQQISNMPASKMSACNNLMKHQIKPRTDQQNFCTD
jgi:hypothetical protein